MKRYVGAGLLIVVATVVHYAQRIMQSQSFISTPNSQSKPGNTLATLKWQSLAKLNYRTQKIADPRLQALLGKRVRIPGFAVPLSDNLSAVDEFLLVPNQMACIHVPPPPPNLMVYAKLKRPVDIDDIVGAIWVEGILHLKSVTSLYGSASWELSEIAVKPFLFDEESM